MRRTILALAVLTAWLAPALAARGGLYNSVDRAFFSSVPAEEIKTTIVLLRSCRLGKPAPKGSYQETYEEQVALLEKRGSLTSVERAELGAYYLRLNRPQKAITLLEAGDQTHFLILLHLAYAYHEAGVLERAIDRQRQALARWPSVWAWWTGPEWGFYRRAEQAYLKLLQLRLNEERLNRGRTTTNAGLDALFPGVRFVDPSGQSDPGNSQQEEIDKMPDIAPQVVFRMVIWRPHDDKLVWLLAEMLNIGGEVDIAYDLMDFLVYGNNITSWPDLREHRKILLPYAKAMKDLKADSRKNLYFLTGAGFRPPPQGCVAGAISSEMCRWAPTVIPDLEKQLLAGPFPGPGGDPTPPAGPRPWFDWRPLAVGFGTGLAVALLAGLQWQEWRRRRQLARQAAETEAEAEA